MAFSYCHSLLLFGINSVFVAKYRQAGSSRTTSKRRKASRNSQNHQSQVEAKKHLVANGSQNRCRWAFRTATITMHSCRCPLSISVTLPLKATPLTWVCQCFMQIISFDDNNHISPQSFTLYNSRIFNQVIAIYMISSTLKVEWTAKNYLYYHNLLCHHETYISN